ncbi:MAG: Spy0128 family protein, partial [Collinsella sp.]
MLQGANEAKFNNSYKPNPDESSVTDQITATKVLDGRDLKEGEFHFELVEGNDVVAAGTNDAEGNITMIPIEYTAAGEHTYTLREVKGNAGGITYDGKTYTVVTTITDNGDGTLSATHVLKDVGEAKFVNSYKPGSKDSSVTDQITATKSL